MTKEAYAMPPLKPCPFCASTDIRICRGQIVGNSPDNGMRFVRCMECGADTSYREYTDAIRMWNTRKETENGK